MLLDDDFVIISKCKSTVKGYKVLKNNIKSYIGWCISMYTETWKQQKILNKIRLFCGDNIINICLTEDEFNRIIDLELYPLKYSHPKAYHKAVTRKITELIYEKARVEIDSKDLDPSQFRVDYKQYTWWY